MLPSLRFFELDRLSFWLGFFAGTLIWWILGRLRPALTQFRQLLKERAEAARQDLLAGTGVRLGNDTLRHAQAMHLASPLFSLAEILITPRLIAPPVPVYPGSPPPPEEITEQTLPYLPDWPELAAVYHAPMLSLAEALQGGCHLAVIGQPGSGKTVALAHLAIQVVRRDPEICELGERVPLLVHAADLNLNLRSPEDHLAALLDAISGRVSALTLPRLPGFLDSALSGGRVLLLLDGLDELPLEAQQQVSGWLEALLRDYPGTQVVAAAALQGFPRMNSLGFVPMSLAAWDLEQRLAFIKQWNAQWVHFVAPSSLDGSRAVDPLLLSGWLLNDATPLTPLELTLKVWAAHAGDALGPKGSDALEAYVRRVSMGIPKARQALEQLAFQMTVSMQPATERKDAEAWIAQYEPPAPQNPAGEAAPDQPEPPLVKPATQVQITTARVLPGLIESGVLVTRLGGRLSFVHPVITGYLIAASYLAGSSLGGQAGVDLLEDQPDWTGKELAQRYLAACQDTGVWKGSGHGWLNRMLDSGNEDVLLSGPFRAARWIRDLREDSPWRLTVMRQLASTLQDESLPMGLRARALVALASLNSSGVSVLFRQALTAPQSSQRLLAALGCGMQRDAKTIGELTELLADPVPGVRRAACLALVAIGDKTALEAVASALLHGEESLRRTAAEALANHPEEGYPTLEEGSTLDDLLVRRAVVYGLARIRQPWATQILEKMQVEDNQWVVKNAATQALEELAQPNPRIYRPLPPLTQTAWLIAFAGEKGMGVAPGKPALDLLMLALMEGNEEQRLAALEYLSRTGGEETLPAIQQVYSTTQGEIREAALKALWHLSSYGLRLPTPAVSGFK